jgi:mono/diheme cytochrome c family protein
MNRISTTLLAFALATASTTAIAQSATQTKSVAEGAELARMFCDSCHAVGPNQPAAVTLKPPPPSFSDIANGPNASAKAVRRFIMATHWDERTFPMTMPNPLLLDEEADKVAAYILSLRNASLPPPPRPPAHPTAKAQQIDVGEELALRRCSLCHVVSSDRRFRPELEQPTPSFAQIANSPGTTEKSLRRFITMTHWDDKTIPMTMPEQMLEADETTDVVSYILSLRKPGS